MLELGRDRLGRLEDGGRCEWLVANGAGGFACGTIPGLLTRRYHALLVAALEPPARRVVLVRKADLTVRLEDPGEVFRLGLNQYRDGTIDPQGHHHLESFHLELGLPVWTWALAGCRLEQRLWMERGQSTTWLSLRHARGSRPMQIAVAPLCTARDYHQLLRGERDLGLRARLRGFEIDASDAAPPCRMSADRGRFVADPVWHHELRHELERERGLDDLEDLLVPGRFEIELLPGEATTFCITLAASGAQPAPGSEPDLGPAAGSDALERERLRRQGLLARAAVDGCEWTRALVLAADAYLVERPLPGAAGARGASIIAGYPWFGDWGRDTMIALPGLATATGRHDDAARVLRSYATHLSEGMLPNRFPERGAALEFNTADATLWWFQAAHAHIEATGDEALARDLWPALTAALDWHQRGTRFGIAMDPADDLLRAGEPGLQLTWMDARVGEWVVTPRIGKPVEINALWHGAHAALATIARRLGRPADAARLEQRAQAIATRFRARFWDPSRQRLHDVVDGPEGELLAGGGRADPSLRPNQIFAISLPFDLLAPDMAGAVLAAIERELLTSFGLRSYAASEPGYHGRYEGGPRERDGAYHQGTVWSWLLGPYALAHFRVHGDAAAARAHLLPLLRHLAERGVGQIAEIFDGDPPHAPRGCFAQAWSVGETLRAWRALR